MFGGGAPIVTTTSGVLESGKRGEMESWVRTETFWWRRIVLHPDSNRRVPPFFRFQFHRWRVGRVYMEILSPSKSAERISLEGELHKWFSKQGVSEEGSARAVRLLDARELLAQPRPSRWNRKGEFGIQARCRYLWYRHAARILGWCERQKFPDLVTGLLRGHVFPAQDGGDEAPRTDDEGRLSAVAPAGPNARDADQRSAGQSHIGSLTMSPFFG